MVEIKPTNITVCLHSERSGTPALTNSAPGITKELLLPGTAEGEKSFVERSGNDHECTLELREHAGKAGTAPVNREGGSPPESCI